MHTVPLTTKNKNIEELEEHDEHESLGGGIREDTECEHGTLTECKADELLTGDPLKADDPHWDLHEDKLTAN